MKNLLRNILRILSKRVINRYQPVVVGITGSVGKTTAKEAVFAVLRKKFFVRKSEDKYNNEIGITCVVLGIDPMDKHVDSSFKKTRFILEVIKSLWLVYGYPKSRYPSALVLELGADKPRDIAYLVEIVKPIIGVVTAIGEVPVHVEFYASPQAVAKEKATLIKSLPSNGFAVLNYDDQTVLDMKNQTRAKAITIGFSPQADIWASDMTYYLSDDQKKVGGLAFKVHRGESFIPVRSARIIAPHQIYGILAATAVGLYFNMNLVEIAKALEYIEFPRGRMNLLQGIKNTIVIDDTYNSSPLSAHAALDILKDFSDSVKRLAGRGRTIAVLGDMKELGKYEVGSHEALGTHAAKRADILITLGVAAELTGNAALPAMGADKVFKYTELQKAADKLQEIIQEGDIILIKGSQSMRMEKIVKEIMAEPQRASELLCRQSAKWLNAAIV